MSTLQYAISTLGELEKGMSNLELKSFQPILQHPPFSERSKILVKLEFRDLNLCNRLHIIL